MDALASTSAISQAQAQHNPLRERAEEMEGVFLNTLVSEMFKGLKTDGMFGGGYAEETWRGMMSEQYANEIAQSGGIGLADEIVASLIETQQGAGASVSPATATGAYSR